MKHAYRWAQPLLAALLLFVEPSASAQQPWRPFRPGLIYTYEASGTAGNGMYVTAGVYTLRLDSAYVTAFGDSAWAFNRVLREVNGLSPGESYTSQFRKSRNNLFGQRLLWQPGSAEYTLETLPEGNAQTGIALRLRPRAAVASTWVASPALGISATLTSRGLQTVNGQPDTVANITLSTGAIVRMSRRFGLLEGPQWLTLSGSARQWVATQPPATLVQSQYSPLRLFDFQPGDEIGYLDDPIILTGFACRNARFLRRIVSRNQTADSLIYTYRTQSRNENYGYPSCGVGGITYSAIETGRWAFSLLTGKSNQFPDMPLLTGEYRTRSMIQVSMSRGIVQLQPGSSSCGGDQRLIYDQLVGSALANSFGIFPDLDTQQHFSPSIGLGALKSSSTYIIYYRRTRGGVTQTCGSPSTFVNLLPTRAAQTAALATLHPNPAANAATLTLATPARPGYALRLTDVLGRPVWSAPVPTGQTAVLVPLAAQLAGLYLLHLSGPDATSATWKLTHE